MKAIPNPIRQIRDALSEARGATVTQSLLAKELGISRSLVNALETRASRPVSDDLKRRLMENYGISFAPANAGERRPRRGPGQPVCIAGAELPLAEALRKFRSQRTVLDAAALGAFDAEEIPNIRAALLAARRAGKAARLYFAVSRFVHTFLHEHELWESYELAKKEIMLNGGRFPEGSSRYDVQSKLLLSLRELQSTGAQIEGAIPVNSMIEDALANRDMRSAPASPTPPGKGANAAKAAKAVKAAKGPAAGKAGK
jgi:hypothetical protein